MSTPDHALPADGSGAGPRRLQRSADDRWVAGVCGGIADYTGLDPLLVRFLTVAVVLLGLGSTILVYLAAWLIVPDARHR